MSFSVYITREIPEAGLKFLKDKGVEIEINTEDRAIDYKELLEKVKNKDGVICMLNDNIDKNLIKNAESVSGFANYAVGYNNIDIKTAKLEGKKVSNTPGVLTDATATLAWSLLMACARRTVESDNYFRTGKWTGWAPKQFLGYDITGKTLGIIGAGRIGTSFALKSRGFNMKVIYTSRSKNNVMEKELNATKVELDELLKQSDYISIHTALTPETKHLITANELKQMKNNAILINTARGPIIDEIALIDALKNKTIAAAGLDVFENEPIPKEGLTDLQNIVCLPHIGSATYETRDKMSLMVAENIWAMMNGNTAPNEVM